MTLIFAQCNPVSKLGKKEYLLIKNTITIEKQQKGKSKVKANYETIADLEDYLQQRPNTKMLGIFKFHLGAYNFTTRRRRKQKSDDTDPSFTKKIETDIQKIVGEPPVLSDSVLIAKTVRQMKLYLYNKGYFNNQVNDSTVYLNYLKHDGGKARVYYTIIPGPQYTIGKLSYQIRDLGIASKLNKDEKVSLIQIGSSYDENTLNKERERIVKELKNLGYFFFSKGYISFEADTTLNGHSIGLTLKIDPFKEKSKSETVERNHRRYRIGKIFIQPDFYPAEEHRRLDTVSFNGYHFLVIPGSVNEARDQNGYVKFNTIIRKTFMRKDEYFMIDKFDNTYKHLASLNIFKFINIQFQRTDNEGELNCLIQLNPIPQHTIQIEAEGTNASGNLGIAENFIYRNKNMFKGAELFEASIKTALEAQKVFTDNEQTIDDLGLFNTIEAGPEVKIKFPRLLFPVKEERIPKRYDPKSTLNLLYNYQQRADYTRWIWEGGLSYAWKESQRKTHVLSPVNVSSVKIKEDSPILDSAFANAFLRNSFTDHFIAATRYSFIYTSQRLNKKVNFTYFRGNIEVAGNALRAASGFTSAEADTGGVYSVFGIDYSQYVRADLDVRNYNFINQHSTIVFRFAAGLGFPYGNSSVMPFEKSFFSGGANGLRAWQARNIGPGAYNGDINFDQIADIKLEANIESRFEFIGPLEGAAFIDAGNIWLTHDDVQRDGAQFKFNSFYNEIAIGAGLGIRLNYDYFIIRVDVAMPVKDPSKPVGKRWVVDNASFDDINYNLGIGYPF